MCSLGGGSSASATKIDPAPVAVQSADVGTDSVQDSQKKKRGRKSTEVSTDRATILGSLANGDNSTGNRSTLG